jgi:putative PIN family toxin of toxin-antitoxin system
VRIVADTNIVLSGLLWSGPPQQLIHAARAKRIELYISVALSAEFAEVIAREQFAMRIRVAGLSAAELVADYARLARIVTAAEITPTVSGDPDDDEVLACALAARADAIVSGDKRLRNLKTYQGIPILGTAEALALIARRASST